MRRWPAAAAIAFLGAAVTLVPVGAAADEVTTTAPPETTTTAIATTTGVPSSSVAATSTTSISASTTTRSTPHRTAAADAHASTDHVIKVSSDCAYFCFAPATMSIAAGDTVTWSNTSDVPHPVQRCTPAACDGKSGGTAIDANFGSAEIGLPAGKSFQYTFEQPGTYVYFCTLHGYALMHGTITVAAATPTTTVDFTPLPTEPPPTPAPTVSTGPHLASTGGRTNGLLTVALIMLTLGFAAASAGFRRNGTS